MADEKPSILKRCRDWAEAHEPWWRAKWEARTELRRFLQGDRYEDDHGEFNRDRRMAQAIGQEIQDTHRHITAVTTSKPRSIQGRPIDNIDDPEAVEVAVALIEGELNNPDKGFDEEEEQAIQDAREARIGIVWMDWHPDFGPYGEIFFTYVDGNRVMWDEAYINPHHPLCGCLRLRCRMDVDRAKKIYKAPWLVADREAGTLGQGRADRPLQQNARDRVAPPTEDDNKVTLDQYWYKNDPEYMKKKPDPMLPKEQWYMSCASDCGYRSDPQGMLQEKGELEGDLPEADAPGFDDMGQPMGGCPTCGGRLERIDTKAEEETLTQYALGKRLVIDAPFSPAPDPDTPVYDGAWPVPKARSFPGYFITAYTSPGDPVPRCDTDFMWPQQAAQDQLDTAALQQVLEHRNIYLWPGDGISDINGERYEARDDQMNHAFKDMSKASQWGPLTVDVLNPSGVDPNYMAVRQVFNDNLTRYTGKSDIGLNSEVDKGQSGVALAQRNQVGEIPVAHFRRRRSRALSQFAGVLYDYITATYTPARLSRLRIEGVDIVSRLWADDLPNFDFQIEDTPDNDGLDEQRAKTLEVIEMAIQKAVTLGVDPIEYIEIVADTLKLTRSTVRKMEKLVGPIAEQMQMQKMMDEAMQMDQAMGGGKSPGTAGPGAGKSKPPSPDSEAEAMGMDPMAEVA